MRRRRRRRRVGSLPSFDDLLGLVVDHYQAIDPAHLPGPVQDAYVRARASLDSAAHSVASTLNLDLTDLSQQARAVGAVLGGAVPSLVAAGESIFAGNAQAGFDAMEAASIGILMAIDPAIGAMAAVATEMAKAIVNAWPASGATGPICAGWYGGVAPDQHAPFGPEDSAAWIPWTNKTKGLRTNGADCADDTPTVPNRSVTYFDGGARAWQGVSGQWVWLEQVIAAAPSEFDVQACHALGALLEKYMNRRGPAPSTVGPQTPWPTFDVSDAVYAMLAGWNATRLGPAIVVDTGAPPMRHVPASSSSWAGKTTTTPAHDEPDPDAIVRTPGAVLWKCMPPGHVLHVNTGPLNPDLATVFQKPRPTMHLRGARPLTKTPAAAQDAAAPEIAVVYPYWWTGRNWTPEPGQWGDLGAVWSVKSAHPGAPVGFYAWDGSSMQWKSA